MEVLISIGILAVGLSAVVALIPAGGSEAQRALREDRKANVGLAALEDAVTRGILSPTLWAPAQTPPYKVLFDPIGGAAFAGLNLVTLDNVGANVLTADEVFRSQDDPSYTLDNSGEDGPPEPLYYSDNLKRLSDGNYSWLATLVPAGNGQNYRLSVVTFHNRGSRSDYQLTDIPTTTSAKFAWTGSVGSFRETFPRGSIVLLHDDKSTPLDFTDDTWEWRRIIFATLAANAGTAELLLARPVTAQVDLVGSPPRITTLYAFEGAVGVVERTARLEGVSPWTQ